MQRTDKAARGLKVGDRVMLLFKGYTGKPSQPITITNIGPFVIAGEFGGRKFHARWAELESIKRQA